MSATFFRLCLCVLGGLFMGWGRTASAQTSCELFPLSAPVPRADTFLGGRTSVSGRFAIVGAAGDGYAGRPGQAVVYEYRGGVWSLQQELTAPGSMPDDGFGNHVFIDENTALVAAYNYSRATPRSSEGRVYVYTRQGSQWVLTGTIDNPNPAFRAFGWSLAKSGSDVVIGTNYNGSEKHAVYVFRQPATPSQPWALVATLTPQPGLGYDYGYSVAIQGDALVVGSLDAFNRSTSAAYFYHRSPGGTWALEQVESYPQQTRAGTGVAVHGRFAAIGTDSNNGLRIYERTASGWKRTQTLLSPDSPGYRFGHSVAMNATTLLVTNFASAVYRYTLVGGRWQFSRRYRPNPVQTYDAFSTWISLDEFSNNLCAGAPNRSVGGLTYAGQAFVLWQPALLPAGPYCLDSPDAELRATAVGGTWAGPGIVDAAAGTFSPATAGAGVHRVTYSLATAGCSFVDTLYLTVRPATRISRPAGRTLTCRRDTTWLLQASPAGGRWRGTGVTASGQFSTALAGPGRHVLTYLSPDSSACQPQDTLSLVITPAPVRILSRPPVLCRLDTSLVLQASDAGGTWSSPSGSVSATGRFSAGTAGPGQHLIRYRRGTGRCAAADSITITVRPLATPQLQSTAPVLLRCGATTTELRLAAAPAPGTNIQWQLAPAATGPWQPVGPAATLSLTASQAGWYRAQARSGSCQAVSAPVQVSIEPLADRQIPNVFTPNADQVNDVFVLQLPNARTFQLQIFDRWGRQVFMSRQYGQFWDGQGAAAGVYYYLVKYTTDCDTTEQLAKGHVTLLR